MFILQVNYWLLNTHVLRDLTHIMGIITTRARPKQTYRMQKYFVAKALT